MNTASQIANSTMYYLTETSSDVGEAIQDAINLHLPDASDDYKASVYAFVMEHTEGESLEARIEEAMNLA